MPDSIAPPAALLVLSRYRVPVEQEAAFADQARTAIAALGRCAGFVSAEIGQSTDEAELRVIATRWTAIGSYRRALSSPDVKMHAIPFLSLSVDEPSAFEVVHARTPEGTFDGVSGLAADAASVGLRDAAAASVPPVQA